MNPVATLAVTLAATLAVTQAVKPALGWFCPGTKKPGISGTPGA